VGKEARRGKVGRGQAYFGKQRRRLIYRHKRCREKLGGGSRRIAEGVNRKTARGTIGEERLFYIASNGRPLKKMGLEPRGEDRRETWKKGETAGNGELF